MCSGAHIPFAIPLCEGAFSKRQPRGSCLEFWIFWPWLRSLLNRRANDRCESSDTKTKAPPAPTGRRCPASGPLHFTSEVTLSQGRDAGDAAFLRRGMHICRLVPASPILRSHASSPRFILPASCPKGVMEWRHRSACRALPRVHIPSRRLDDRSVNMACLLPSIRPSRFPPLLAVE